MKTKLLITGASGFVGGSFCRRHAERDELELRGLSRRETGMPGHICADLTRPLDLDWSPDLVIHAAARSSPWGTLREFRRQNVLATKHVLDFCEAHSVKKLVFVSSSSVFYRDGDQFGISETSPIGPSYTNAYARSKHEAELLVSQYSGSWCILRPRAVFGPGDTVLFPRLLRAAKQGRMITISRPGPPPRGDLIYIDTLSDYLLQAALNPAITGDFNLTNHEAIEIQPFLAEIFSRLDLPLPRRTLSLEKALRLASTLERLHRCFLPWIEPPLTRYGVGVLAWSKTFDVSKSLRAFGPPSVSIAEGVDRFIEWQRLQGT